MTRERAAGKIDSTQHFVTASYFFGWQTVILPGEFSIFVHEKIIDPCSNFCSGKCLRVKNSGRLDKSIVYNPPKWTVYYGWTDTGGGRPRHAAKRLLSIGEITSPLTLVCYRGKQSLRNFNSSLVHDGQRRVSLRDAEDFRWRRYGILKPTFCPPRAHSRCDIKPDTARARDSQDGDSRDWNRQRRSYTSLLPIYRKASFGWKLINLIIAAIISYNQRFKTESTLTLSWSRRCL